MPDLTAAVDAALAAAALLLLVSAVAKLLAPDATSAMLVTLVTPLRRRPRLLRPVSRGIGVVEAVVALLVLAVGGRVPAALLALAYLAFATVALALVRSPRPVSCGCFGRSDAPVTAAHVALDVVAAVVAAAALISPVPRLGGLFDDGIAVAFAGPVSVALLAWLAYLSITALPALASARRLVETT